MTLVPLGVRLLLIGILLPLLALLGRYRTGRTAEELLVRTAPRLGPVLHKASALLLGPLGLMPLTAFLASRLWSSLLGVEGVWPVLLGSVLPLLAAGALAAVLPRNAGRRAAGVLAGVALLLLAAGALAALSGGSFPASPAVDPFPLEALDCHVGFMFLLAPAALPVLRAGGREETGKDALKSRPFRPALLGAAWAVATAVLWFLLAARCGGVQGLTAAGLAAAVSRSSLGRSLAGLGLFLTSAAVLTGGLAVWPGVTRPESRAGKRPAFLLAGALAGAFLLSLPPVAAVWLKLACSLLLGLYPALAVTVIFYALVPGCFQPRKQYSLRLAFRAVSVWGLVMAAYRATVAFGLELFLFHGLYENLFMARNHMTWLLLAVLFFIYGDMRYRKRESALPKQGK